MKQYETFEISFQGPVLEDSWAAPQLQAVFVNEDLKNKASDQEFEVTAEGFYDGDGIYKVRFLPEYPGEYTWKVTGIVNEQGREFCQSADEKHHGKVIAKGTAFCFQDGEKYLPFGTTVYALAHQPDELVRQTLDTLSEAPFNKVRMCLFPKHYDFNKNEPPVFPFEKDGDGNWRVDKPCISFWHRFEKILDKLEEMDIQIDLILLHPYDRWGFSKLGVEATCQYLDYLLRRLAARPNIWWSLANEFDLMPAYTMEDWNVFEEFVAAHDPYRHLLSNHNCMKYYDYSRPNITHVCLQTVWVEKADEWIRRFNKPVMYDEMCYEGNIPMNWGNISAFEMVNRFWAVCAKGAYGTHGETFLSEDNILWWAAGGVLKGESPKRIQWLKDIMYSLPGPLVSCGSRTGMTAQIPDDRAQAEKMLEKMMGQMSEEMRLFAKVLVSMTPYEREMFQMKNTKYAGRCGEDAYLTYFAHTCPGVTTLELPEQNTYKVEILDVWNMTRTIAAEDVNGSTKISLPGKEGIAVLATKTGACPKED